MVKLQKLPKIVSTKDIQRRYRSVFDEIREDENPAVVMRNNKPDVVILTAEMYDEMAKAIREWEMKDALEAISEYKQEKKAGTLKSYESLEDLLNDKEG